MSVCADMGRGGSPRQRRHYREMIRQMAVAAQRASR